MPGLVCSRQRPSRDPDVELVDWIGPADPDNPYNWPLKRKWIVTAIAIFATFTTLIDGTIITVAHDAINQEFGVSDAKFPNSYWPVTTWAFGGALCSLIVLPIMEDFGIRWVFLTTYTIFICFIIPQALAPNFATLVVTRFFSGGCVSTLANTSAGVIGNIWESDRDRSIPMSIFVWAYLAASSTGPVIGAPIYQYLSWRWIGYLQLIWYGAFFPIYFFLLRESRGSAVLLSRAKQLRKLGKKAYTKEELEPKSVPRIIVNSVKRPLYMIFTEPVVFVFTLWSSFSVGIIYLFTQSVEQVFVGLYDWTPVQAGYVQSAIVIGECLGWTGSLLSVHLYFASASRNTEIPGTPIPEARLYMSVVGGFAGVSGGMFVYAWTAYPNLPWIAPAIGLAMVGFGSQIVVLAIAEYVVDAYSNYAGTVVASVVLGENTFAAFLPLAAQSMYSNLGFQWASTLLALLSIVLSFAPVLILVWGRHIRARSPFMKEALEQKKRALLREDWARPMFSTEQVMV